MPVTPLVGMGLGFALARFIPATPSQENPLDGPQPLIADKAKLEAIVGRELPEVIFSARPWGHRVIVVRETPQQFSQGGLHIPNQAQRLPNRGWIVSVGHLVGEFRPDYVGFCPFARELLPGTKVVFGAAAGYALKVTDEEDAFGESPYVQMTDNEVWFDLGGPPKESIVGERT